MKPRQFVTPGSPVAAVIHRSTVCWRALIVLALLASGCAGLPPPFGPPTESSTFGTPTAAYLFGSPPTPATVPPHLAPTLAQNPELANDPDLVLFMTALADQGVIPLSSDTSQNPILRPAPGLGYRFPQGHLHVHVYPTADDAHQRAPQARVELAQSIAAWIGTPHLFECGRLLAMYFGDDAAELAAVGEACTASENSPGTPTAPPSNAATSTTAAQSASPRPVVLYDEWPAAGLPTDPATVESVMLEGNTLTIEVTHAGGCATHTFELYVLTAFRTSLPPEALLHLAHDAQGDTCKALIHATLIFDLSLLGQARNHPSETPLRLAVYAPQGDAFAAEPFQALPLWE